MSECRIYWGESHDNTYQTIEHQAGHAPPHIQTALERGKSHLDFYCAAYYTAESPAFRPGGHLSESDEPHRLILEDWKSEQRLDAEWAEVQEATKRMNDPGRFVTFPGYEWQGDGSSGDHNVYARCEGTLLIHRVQTVAELYERLRGSDALAIPHHVAYRSGLRGRDWSVYDERLSPYCEIYSIHGCSEIDDEWVGMRTNAHMGPNYHAGTWQAALDRGHHLGCICSTDNWGRMPGHYGRGLMAVRAAELTREALWDAFRARRVYGVTGDRIQLDFRVNGADMGSTISAAGKRSIQVRVTGSYELDRVELLRNGRVIATHCHQGTWDMPRPHERSKFKMRVEAGWGPRADELKAPDHAWDGELELAGGRMLGFEPCWVSPGQGRPDIHGGKAAFSMVSSAGDMSHRSQNANVFEFEAEPRTPLRIRMNELEEADTVAGFASGSREMWFRDECVRMLQTLAGIEPGSPQREDIYHHVAHKVKLHRPMPEAAYKVECAWEDDEPLGGEVNYRIRVEQRNAQRAWSSPVWVRPEPGSSTSNTAP